MDGQFILFFWAAVATVPVAIVEHILIRRAQGARWAAPVAFVAALAVLVLLAFVSSGTKAFPVCMLSGGVVLSIPLSALYWARGRRAASVLNALACTFGPVALVAGLVFIASSPSSTPS